MEVLSTEALSGSPRIRANDMASRRKNPYPLLIVVLLGAFVLFLAWSARQAATHGSRVSDPEYYSKGLKYNHTRVEERAAASRGWQLETRIVGHKLEFSLHAASGKPLSRANGELTLFLPEQKKVLHLPAVENAPGRYQLELPAEAKGSLQAHVEFELQGARIYRQLLVNI